MPRQYRDLSALEMRAILNDLAASRPKAAIAKDLGIGVGTVSTVARNHAQATDLEIEAAVAKLQQYRRWWNALFKRASSRDRPIGGALAFTTADILEVQNELGLSGNPYDLKYNQKGRGELPVEIRSTAPAGMEWRVIATKKGEYAFTLRPEGQDRIDIDVSLPAIPVLDAIPSIVELYARKDEQALLARIRYNNLVGVFLEISAHSLQSHWKTAAAVTGIPTEIDEVYVGFDRDGRHFIVCLEAKSKGSREALSAEQVLSAHMAARRAFPKSLIVSVGAKAIDDHTLVLIRFEVDEETGDVRKDLERRYRLWRG